MRDLATGGTEEVSKEGEWLERGRRRVGRTSQAAASDSEQMRKRKRAAKRDDLGHRPSSVLGLSRRVKDGYHVHEA